MSYISEINKYRLLGAEEEQELMKRSSEGDLEARNILISSNLRLVVKIAHKYKGMGVDLFDIIQAGNEGLAEAAKRCQPKKKSRFITFAQFHIHHHMKDELSKMSGAVSMSVGTHGRRKNLLDEKDKMGDDFTVEELAKKCGRKNVKNVQAMLNSGNYKVSLDDFVDADNKKTYLEFIETSEDGAERQYDRDERIEILLSKLEILDDIELCVIESRYGLFGKEEMTLREISKVMNKSAERIRQIQNEAEDKLRKAVLEEEKSVREKQDE